MTEKKTIPRCKDCARSLPSLFGNRACSCELHGPHISFPKLLKACANYKPKKHK